MWKVFCGSEKGMQTQRERRLACMHACMHGFGFGTIVETLHIRKHIDKNMCKQRRERASPTRESRR